MVHALQEVRGVLDNHAALVDLRPVLDKWPVEVASRRGAHVVGYSIDLPEPLHDDRAANEAMDQAAAAGFTRERSEEFSLFYYWDTPREMQEYIDDSWSDVIRIDESTWAALRSQWAVADPDTRVRLRMKLAITRYRVTPG